MCMYTVPRMSCMYMYKEVKFWLTRNSVCKKIDMILKVDQFIFYFNSVGMKLLEFGCVLSNLDLKSNSNCNTTLYQYPLQS